jgi:phosphoribosylaminoimidazolecarboxamide formyltransferase/IMP cyclohydrolase
MTRAGNNGSGSQKQGDLLQIKRALLSVSDKRGLKEFAEGLVAHGVEIISTGGTYKTLDNAGIPVTNVTQVTGFPEILDGRVKTLHPSIHAGILAALDKDQHTAQLAEHSIEPIDLVVVNLYPFEKTVAQEDVRIDQAVEQIDIGGPAMVRAAAKNFHHTAVVVNPDLYGVLLAELSEHQGAVTAQTRFLLSLRAFEHTAQYDAAIAKYLGELTSQSTLPESLAVSARKVQSLRYGENPHQEATLYGSFAESFVQLHGKDLSYNNILDINASALLCGEFSDPTVIIVKHNNPCGAASGSSLSEAYQHALATDTTSAFGGIVCVNRPLDRSTAESIDEIFTEVIVAPDYQPGVLEFLTRKKNRRVIRQAINVRTIREVDIRNVLGGFLAQTQDQHRLHLSDVKVVTERQPSEEEMESLMFGWHVAKHAKSNAIVYTRGPRTLGVGAGQMSRVDSAKIAAIKASEAGFDLGGCAVASDAFFPFPDGLLEAVRVGATAVIQPGGSVRDGEVIEAANANGVAMVFTGIRHFRH